MTTFGIAVMAVLLPAGIILTFLAVTKWGNSRRFQKASATAFFLIAAWYLVSTVMRALQGDFGMLFFIELLMIIGFGFQAFWVWRVDLDSEER